MPKKICLFSQYYFFFFFLVTENASLLTGCQFSEHFVKFSSIHVSYKNVPVD